MKKRFNFLLLIATLTLSLSTNAVAETAEVINAKADAAIAIFKQKPGAARFLSEVQGYLVFPSVLKGGFIIGGEYGEGVLRIQGETTAYYNMASASVGFQAGGQKASYIIAFASQGSLEKFQRSSNWQGGIDGGLTAVKWGVGKDIASLSFEQPVYAFVFNAKGLMGSLSLEGSKFTKIQPGKTNVYDEIQKYTK